MLFGFLFLSILAFTCGAPASLTGDLIDVWAASSPISAWNPSLPTSQISRSTSQRKAVTNPLLIQLTFERVVLSADINTTEYISFDHTFEDPIVVPILGTADSGGGFDTLDIVSLEYLDLINPDVNLREATVNGKLGIPVNATGLTQKLIPTTFVKYGTPLNKQGSS
ncbi:hypothetical protein F5146DRAFT_1006391 [Armillaria mellea]|nr:hypothetical protein F5146DRAFT_1006391 [Armillaria mellea]